MNECFISSTHVNLYVYKSCDANVRQYGNLPDGEVVASWRLLTRLS